MGTWGTKILDDDFACEVVASYFERLHAGDGPKEASNRVIEAFGPLDLDERCVFWLALAKIQHDYGRLVEPVRSRALEIIASGEDLARWSGDKGRARVLAGLARALEGPPKPVKKLPRRPPTLHQGDIFRLPLDDGRYAFGRVLTATERAFYGLVSTEKRPPFDDIVASPVLFVVGSDDDGFASRTWVVLGNRPLEARLKEPIYFYTHAVGDDYCDVYDIWHPEREFRKPVAECGIYEEWGSWASHHCRDRILSTLAGEPCEWLQDRR